MPNNSDLIWAGERYSTFGFRIPYVNYELYPDKIRIVEGMVNRRIQEVSIHRIVSMEIYYDMMGRWSHCGKIRLVFGNRKVPDIYMAVKNPEEVMDLIDQTKRSERERYIQRRKKVGVSYANERKRV